MPDQPLPYKVAICRGTSTPIIPKPATTGDIEYWDNTEKKKKILSAPVGTGTFVLGFKDGALVWLTTSSC